MAYIGNPPAPQHITSSEIADGTIVNVDIAADAAIAATKIAGLSTVATSGAYSDVTGTPTIPVAGADFVAQTGGTFTGDVSFTGELIADSYNETYATLTPGSGINVDCETGNVFALTTNQSCTFTFTNPPASGTAYGFTLKLTSGIGGTVTWPTSVDWTGGSAPDSPANGETNVLVFITYDGGTTWYGFQAGDAMA